MFLIMIIWLGVCSHKSVTCTSPSSWKIINMIYMTGSKRNRQGHLYYLQCQVSQINIMSVWYVIHVSCTHTTFWLNPGVEYDRNVVQKYLTSLFNSEQCCIMLVRVLEWWVIHNYNQLSRYWLLTKFNLHECDHISHTRFFKLWNKICQV